MTDLFSIKDKVVLITGGAGLLGIEYARALSFSGANVVILDVISENVLEKKAAEVQKHSGNPVLGIHADITKPEDVKTAIGEIIKKYGRIDVLINNACMNPVPGSKSSADQWKPYENYPIDLWKKELDVGLTGTLIVTQAVVPHMMRQKSGSIINISSHYGIQGPDPRIYANGQFKSIAYATIKSGIINFTQSWAARLSNTGIRVNTLTLGGVAAGQDKKFIKKYSDRTMLGRMAKPGEYNGALLFLASDASSYMTGANLLIDGGWTAW